MDWFEGIYQKTNTYKGVLYLHAWNNPPTGFSWIMSKWHNISLRHYDEVLPELTPGQTIYYEGEVIGHSGMFIDILLRQLCLEPPYTRNEQKWN